MYRDSRSWPSRFEKSSVTINNVNMLRFMEETGASPLHTHASCVISH